MIKRISLVWKRHELTDKDFRRIWLGDHVYYAKQLPGLREYSIDFIAEGASDVPSAIATLRFDSRDTMDAAFEVPGLRDQLWRTREQFARDVRVAIVDECVVLPRTDHR
jgi:uncharacterized protein (TIGR02118 family)